jgi:lysophospholipase L1-like esterase
MKILLISFLITIIIHNYSCTKSKTLVEKLIKIVVLGSSTAAGTGPTHPDSAWVNRFRTFVQQSWPGSEVINLAVGGYKTYQILPDNIVPQPNRPEPDPDHNITKALSFYPTAIIINLPSNDASFGYSVKEQLANYDTIRSITIANKIPLWIATTQPRNLSDEGRKNLMDMRDSTFTRFKNPIDFWTGLAEENGNIKSQYNCGDDIHLNDAAHRILFKRAVKARAGFPSVNNE